MVQQRKAQQKESLAPKQSLLPVRANKKQFTVPHPLSGKLQLAREGQRDAGPQGWVKRGTPGLGP